MDIDVERFSELLQQFEAGETSEGSSETSYLPALASGLIDLAAGVALPEDAQARIFAEMQAMDPSLQPGEAYDLDPALSMLALRLEGLDVASEEMDMEELAGQPDSAHKAQGRRPGPAGWVSFRLSENLNG